EAGCGSELAAQAGGLTPAVDVTAAACFRDARPTAGYDAVSRSGESARALSGVGLDLRVRVQAGGAEEAHGRADLGQRAEALDELGLDAHHPPRILVRPGGPRTAVEQTLIRRRLRHLVTAQTQRPLPVEAA